MTYKAAFALLFSYLIFCFPGIAKPKSSPEIPENFLKNYQSQLSFEQNLGQYQAGIQFQTSTGNQQVRFLENGFSVAMMREIEGAHVHSPLKHPNFQWEGDRPVEVEALVWNARFVNALPATLSWQGKKSRTAVAHYLKGNDPKAWVTDVPSYQELWQEGLYEGIDLRYYGAASHQLKYDFLLQAGASVSSIEMELEGIVGLSLGTEGQLLIQTDWGEVVDARPYAYQMIRDTEVPVEVAYEVRDGMNFGFVVQGPYDPAHALIIDPLTLSWGSFFHSSTSDDYLLATHRDQNDQVYITGYTKTATFPTTPGVYQPTYGGSIDVYVAKFANDGTTLLFSTYLGGSNWEMAYGIGINASKEIYVAGFGASADFPTKAGGFQPGSGGGLVEGFISKLSADGNSLVYSSMLGGMDRDYLYDLKVAPTGEAYVAGYTLSMDFPTTAGAFSGFPGGNGDVFVCKIASDGSSMDYSTLFGGNNYDIANGIALADNGEIFVAGNSGSTNLPTTAGAYQTAANFSLGSNQEDGFLLRLSSDGSQVKYATYLGGSQTDAAYSVDVNEDLEAFVTGITYSTDFPTTLGVYQPFGYGGSSPGDAFVSRLDSTGSSLDFSTYIGGTDLDYGKSIRINEDDLVFVLGATLSANFPITQGGGVYAGMHDVFLCILNQNGTQIEQSAVLGGAYNDYPRSASSLSLRGPQISLGVTTHSPGAYSSPGVYQAVKLNGVADAPWLVGMEYDVVLSLPALPLAASWEEEGVQLSWEVENPANAPIFWIERMNNGEDWESVGSELRPQFAHSYAHTDVEASRLPARVLYYRLRYTDEQGGVAYSEQQEVRREETIGFQMWLTGPNAAGQLQGSCFLAAGQGAFLTVFDVQGRQWGKQELAPAVGEGELRRFTWEVASYPAGVYFLRAASSQGKSEVAAFLRR